MKLVQAQIFEMKVQIQQRTRYSCHKYLFLSISWRTSGHSTHQLPPFLIFFFLEFGRCRAKARSSHEHKLSKRRLYKDTVGPYTQANLSRTTKKHTRPPKHDDPQIPSQTCVSPEKTAKQPEKQTRQTKGAGARTKHPQDRFAKGTQWFDHCITLKNMRKMN